MGSNTLFLYIVNVLIWGSTWLFITFQLGKVDPAVSIFYRFALASLLLWIFCRIRRINLRFSLRSHLFMALQGLFMFSIGYWLVYRAEMHLTSGLVAVVVSSIIFFNIINASIFLKQKIRLTVVAGGLLGLAGLILIFWPEFTAFRLSDKKAISLLMAVAATVLYSFGNVISARNQKNGLPVVQGNLFSMTYATLIMLVLSLVLKKPLIVEASLPYMASLLYLSVFGTIVGFYCYITLIGRIGADRAAYGPMVVPVIALGLSTLFESYRWDVSAIAGLCLLLAGMVPPLASKVVG